MARKKGATAERDKLPIVGRRRACLFSMRKLELTFPEILFLVLTHVVLAAGVTLLAAPRLRGSKRKRVGGVLTAIGVATGVSRIRILLRGRDRSPDFDTPQLSAAEPA